MAEPKKYIKIQLPGEKYLEMVWIPKGDFDMGSPEEEEDRQENEKMHKVEIHKGFYLGKYPITQQQWEVVMGKNPVKDEDDKNDNYPVVDVSWCDVQKFIEKLNENTEVQESIKSLKCCGNVFRLPTEAEWEYACRAGSAGPWSCSSENLDQYAWYYGREENSPASLHRVQENQANGWRLHDMHGHVCEWCEDWYGDYEDGEDPQGPGTCSYRVLRGGGTYNSPANVRSAVRNWDTPTTRSFDIGARLLLGSSLDKTGEK